jgi:predicted esterase
LVLLSLLYPLLTTSDLLDFRFDIDDIPVSDTVVDDEAGLLKSAEQINHLISAEVESGTLPSRIVLGGFSQGGAMSLLTGLTSEKKLAGVLGLSSWLPLRNKFKTVGAHSERTTVQPLIIVVPITAGLSPCLVHSGVSGSWLG